MLSLNSEDSVVYHKTLPAIQKMNRKALTEVSIVGAIVLSIVIIIISFRGLEFFNQDIQIHDTLFNPITILIWISIPIVTLIFIIRGIVQKFKNKWSNTIIIISLIVGIYILINVLQFNLSFFCKRLLLARKI